MFKWLLDHKEDLGWAGAALLATWKFWRLVAKKVSPLIKEIRKIAGVSDRMDAIEKKTDLIEKRQMALISVDNRPIFILNEKNELKSANEAWLEMTEMTNEKDALGFGYLQVIPEDDRDMIIKRSELFLKHHTSFAGNVRFIKLRSKKIFTAYCRTDIIKDNEILVETIGILND